ncbi:unnamed protein product [Rangifer tarandus platyrhynchus]|uniref:Uncharacterized protein n=1 Tax=Rangifer tarandus platyrhynchus TaxID=3082113 RepID=A0AC59ZXC3_RANTA
MTKSWAGAPMLRVPLWEKRTEKMVPCCSPDRGLGCRGVPGRGGQAHLRVNCSARAPPGPQPLCGWAGVWPSCWECDPGVDARKAMLPLRFEALDTSGRAEH